MVCTITGHLIIITVSTKEDKPAPRRQIILLCRVLGLIDAAKANGNKGL
jgi:hypothetical protein